MKYLYKTPEIKVEKLLKQDVLCSSKENPSEIDNYTLLDEIWNSLNDFLGS